MLGKIGVARRVHHIVESKEFPTFWWGVAACGWAGQMYPERDGRMTCQNCIRLVSNSYSKP